MDRLETELSHMLRLLAPPFRASWREYVWEKAKHLEATDLDFAGLTARLAASLQPPSATSSEKPAEQPLTATPGAMPAGSPITRPRASTGRRSSSSRAVS